MINKTCCPCGTFILIMKRKIKDYQINKCMMSFQVVMSVIKKNKGDQRVWFVCIIVFKYSLNSSIYKSDYRKGDE